jgi:pyruvate dehydrogenase E1 component alpha subunit
VARARRGEGPSLIEVETDRYLGHFEGDPQVYRPKDEVAELRKRDPIPRLAAYLRAVGQLDDTTDEAIHAHAHQRVAEAYAFARTSPYPEPFEAFQQVFVA